VLIQRLNRAAEEAHTVSNARRATGKLSPVAKGRRGWPAKDFVNQWQGKTAGDLFEVIRSSPAALNEIRIESKR
jgi:hypothetical protein